MKLSDSSEDQLIQRITSQLIQLPNQVHTGPGDDCAITTLPSGELQLLKTDCVVEGVHFYPEELATRVGWKAIARLVSDIAAMGGTPHSFVVTLVLTPDTTMDWIDGLYNGMQRCASQFNLSIVGGETSSVPTGNPKVVSIAGTGSIQPEQIVLRSTASAGDHLFVTGQLGGSLAGKHLDFIPRLEQAQWLVNHYKPTAMMDLSDGVAKDLPRLAALSKVSYQIDTVPCNPGCTTQQALSDGEDYELLFSIAADHAPCLLNDWPKQFPPLTQIGVINDPSQPSTDLHGGWDHFSD